MWLGRLTVCLSGLGRPKKKPEPIFWLTLPNVTTSSATTCYVTSFQGTWPIPSQPSRGFFRLPSLMLTRLLHWLWSLHNERYCARCQAQWRERARQRWAT